MSSITAAQLNRAQKTVAELSANPPSSPAEMKRRIKPVDQAAGRRVLCDLIADNKAAAKEIDIVMMLAEPFGLGQDATPLLAILKDKASGRQSRKLAMMVLATTNLSVLTADIQDLDLDLLQEVAGDADAALLWPILEEPGLNIEVTQVFLNVEPAAGMELMAALDKARRQLMVPAWLAYADALQVALLADVHEAMLAAITAETRATGVDIWDEIMGLDLPAATWKIVQEAVMRTRTARLNSRGVQQRKKLFIAPASAWISQCDGTGAFVIMIRVQTVDGGLNIYNICLRASGDLRDGFVLGNRVAEEFDDILRVFGQESNFEFVRFPLTVAAALVADARASHSDKGSATLRENMRVAACIQWVCALGQEENPGFREQQLALPVRDVNLAPSAAAELFDHPDFERWFLNAADLAELGVAVLADGGDDARWLTTETPRINTSKERRRLKLMFEHMSWYYNWQQDIPMVQRCLVAVHLLAAGADEAAELMKRYLAVSLLGDRLDAEVDHQPESLQVGDLDMRTWLRRNCFTRLIHPKGKHLAILDLTEAALVAVEKVVAESAMSRRPRLDTLPFVALAIAKAEVDMILSHRSGRDLPADPKRFRRMLNAIRKETGLSLVDAEGLWSAAQPPLASFVAGVCSSCPVGCLWRPTSDMSDWFEYEGHPAFIK